MVMLLGIIIGILVVWGIFDCPEITIPFIIIVFVVGACVAAITDKEETETEITETVDAKTVEVTNAPAEDSIREQCIDGILYLLVKQDSQNFMAPKENRYGDNRRCTE